MANRDDSPPIGVGEKLKRARLSLPGHPTQYAVDAALGVKPGRTAKYEQGPGPRGISQDYSRAWDKVFGEFVPWSYVEDPADSPPPGSALVVDEDLASGPPVNQANPDRALDMYGKKPRMLYVGDIPAGDYDDDPDFAPVEVEVEADVWHPKRYQLRVVGPSMEPALYFGDKVDFHATRNARDGVIVHARQGGRRTVKVARYRDGEWVLEAFNKEFTVPLTEWEIVGYLVTVRRVGSGGIEVRYHNSLGIKPEMLPSTP